MASKRRLRRKQCGKHSFPDEKTANTACLIARKERGQRLHAYRCNFCPTWHIGHIPARVRQSINARRRNEK